MTWTFSHCPNDAIDGCEGCPAVCDDKGKPTASQCAAVFVDGPPPQLSALLSTSIVAQTRHMDELQAASLAEEWMEQTMAAHVPKPQHGVIQPGWAITRATVPDGQPEAHTKVVTLWEMDRPRAFYLLQRDSANFTVATMVLVGRGHLPPPGR